MQVSQFHLFFSTANYTFYACFHLWTICVLYTFSHVRNIFKDFADLARLEKLCLRSWKYTEKQDIWENYTKFSLTRGKS